MKKRVWVKIYVFVKYFSENNYVEKERETYSKEKMSGKGKDKGK